MPRPRKSTGTRRLFLTVDEDVAVAIEVQAEKQQERPVRLAAQLLTDGVRHQLNGHHDDLDALTEARRRIAQQETTIEGLRRRLRARDQADDLTATAPRWEWPIPEVLADEEWWSSWLPRLGELLGRNLASAADRTRGFGDRRSTPVLDSRGYADIMTFLFPPIRDGGGNLLADWHSVNYPRLAFQEWQHRNQGNEGTPGPVRPHVWEPTIRHVVRALCALEHASIPGADPAYGIRVEEELTGAWLRTLRTLTGESTPPELPHASVP